MCTKIEHSKLNCKANLLHRITQPSQQASKQVSGTSRSIEQPTKRKRNLEMDHWMKENSDRDETNTKSASSSSPLLVRMQRVYHFDVKLVNSITYTVGIGRISDCNGTWNQERKMKIVSRMRLNAIASNWLVYTTLHIVDQRSKHKKKYSSNFNILKRFGLVSTGEQWACIIPIASSLRIYFALSFASFSSFQSELYLCVYPFVLSVFVSSFLYFAVYISWQWLSLAEVALVNYIPGNSTRIAFIQGNMTLNMRVSLQIAYFFIWPMSFMHSLRSFHYHFQWRLFFSSFYLLLFRAVCFPVLFVFVFIWHVFLA